MANKEIWLVPEERELLKAALDHLIIGINESIGIKATASSPLAVAGWYTRKLAEDLRARIQDLDPPEL